MEARKAEAEREAEGGDDDHDNRKLKMADRMRLVLKNKEEGNELFSGGNFKVRTCLVCVMVVHRVTDPPLSSSTS